MSMFERMGQIHSPSCPHCLIGCEHEHEETDPLMAEVGVRQLTQGFAVPASQIGPDGVFRDRHSSLVIASDGWRLVRCLCGAEAQTPVEMVPWSTDRHPDGAFKMLCTLCFRDVQNGLEPGHSVRRQWN